VVLWRRKLVSIVSDFMELLRREEEDDYGILKPTIYAFNFTLDLLFSTATAMGPRVACPYGSISTDYEGGVRIEWRNGERSVRLIVPARPEGMRYIYFEDSQTYRAVPIVTAAELRRRLEALSAS